MYTAALKYHKRKKYISVKTDQNDYSKELKQKEVIALGLIQIVNT